jgi:hypothetical protein
VTVPLTTCAQTSAYSHTLEGLLLTLLRPFVFRFSNITYYDLRSTASFYCMLSLLSAGAAEYCIDRPRFLAYLGTGRISALCWIDRNTNKHISMYILCFQNSIVVIAEASDQIRVYFASLANEFLHHIPLPTSNVSGRMDYLD